MEGLLDLFHLLQVFNAPCKEKAQTVPAQCWEKERMRAEKEKGGKRKKGGRDRGMEEGWGKVGN